MQCPHESSASLCFECKYDKDKCSRDRKILLGGRGTLCLWLKLSIVLRQYKFDCKGDYSCDYMCR